MIARVWRGTVDADKGDAYERLLNDRIFPRILSRRIEGFRHIDLFRRPLGDEVEFMTVLWFDSIEAIKRFVGEDYEATYMPDEARVMLNRFDTRSQHYEVLAQYDAAK